MTDPVNTGVPAVAVTPNPTPEATATTAPAAVVETTVTASPISAVDTAPAATVPVTDTPPAAKTAETPVPIPAATEAPKAVSTILGAEPPKPATTPEPAKAPVEGEKPAVQPKADGSPSDEPAPLPTYEKFTLPEGIQMDDKRLGEFTKEIGEFELRTKADHVAVQEFAQNLVNRYVAETQDTVKRVTDYYTNTWDKQTNEWREAFIADPEIGGNRQETTATNVQSLVGEFGGNQEQVAEVRKLMDTGIGNNPALIRLMNNAANAVKELRMKYESEEGVRPLPGRQPITEKKSKTQTLYGKSSAGTI